jgi:hypothetical protein
VYLKIKVSREEWNRYFHDRGTALSMASSRPKPGRSVYACPVVHVKDRYILADDIARLRSFNAMTYYNMLRQIDINMPFTRVRWVIEGGGQ